jgi:pimeloyl-ACP methyl ester carboxylesterase
MTTPQQWREQGDYFGHAGLRAFYRAHRAPGSGGRALVCIHGFPSASWDWHALWDGLCAEFDIVLAPDMFGFGFSDKPRRRRYTIAEQCDLHEALAASMGIRKTVLLAHDYGDTVAQEWLARAIDGKARVQPTAVALLNGGLFPETHRARLVQKLLASPFGGVMARLTNRRSFGRSFAAVFGAETQPDEATLDQFWELLAWNRGQLAMPRLINYIAERRQHRERWVNALVNSPVPLRFINGIDDPVSGGHMVARYREVVPQPDVVELTGIGHYPQIEAPDAVLELFLRWARDVAPKD